MPENTNQPLGLGFWVSRWRRIKWKGREEDCGGGGGEGAPGSPLASPPSIPLPLSLSCSRTHHLASAAHALDRELRVRTHFRPRPILKVLLLAGIKMMYHHYSSSKVSVSISSLPSSAPPDESLSERGDQPSADRLARGRLPAGQQQERADVKSGTSLRQ